MAVGLSFRCELIALNITDCFFNLADVEAVDIRKRLKLAEGHVEAGRLLAYYQVSVSY